MTRARPSLSALMRPLARTAKRRTAKPNENPAVQAIWDAIAAIPAGRVSTYGGIARLAGYPNRARLTAFALRTAEPQLQLPWHRVLGAGGRIVFAKNSRGYRDQSRLLRGEGVSVRDGRVPRELIVDEPS